MPRKFAGRQKIEIKRIAKESSLLVSFSKRRPNVIKKANELSILCGVDIAIIVISPNKKNVYSFGAPSVEANLNRYLGKKPASISSISLLMEEFRKAKIEKLNAQLITVLDQLEVEKKVGENLKKIKKENQEKYWWTAPVENLGIEELEQLKVAMSILKTKVDDRLMTFA